MKRNLILLTGLVLAACGSNPPATSTTSSGTTTRGTSSGGTSSGGPTSGGSSTSSSSSSASSTTGSSTTSSSTTSSSTTGSSTTSSSTTSSSTTSSSTTSSSTSTTSSTTGTTTSSTSSSTGGTSGNTGASVLFTEYVEGSSYNKALELSNLGTATADLSNYIINIYFNHGATPTAISLSGTLAVGTSITLCNPNATFAASCTLTNSHISFNGDDAIQLVEVATGATVDRIGDSVLTSGIWGTGSVTTQDDTLRRKCGITAGDTDFTAPFDPSVEWDGLPIDDVSGLGSPACLGGSSSSSSGSTGTSASSSSGSSGSGSGGSTGTTSTTTSSGSSSGSTGAPAQTVIDRQMLCVGDVSPMKAAPHHAALGDLNHDGILDVVLAVPDPDGLTNNNVVVRLGNGDGTFAAEIPARMGTIFPWGPIYVADLNHDGNLDVVVSNWTGISVLLGNGDGTLQTHIEYATNGDPWELAIADFDGDGILDVMATDTNAGIIRTPSSSVCKFLHGNGDGSFASYRTVSCGSGNTLIRAVDLNRDGAMDVVVANDYASSIAVVYGYNDGGFTAPFPQTGVPGYHNTMALADFTGDGHPDVAVTSWYGTTDSNNNTTYAGYLFLLAGQPDGGPFLAPTALGQSPSSSEYGNALAVAAADANGDGQNDLLVWNLLHGSLVSLLLNHGGGTFASSTYSSTPEASYRLEVGADDLQVADVDGDGQPDLVVAGSYQYYDGGVQVMHGNGNGFTGAIYYDNSASVVLGGDAFGDGGVEIVGGTAFTLTPHGPGLFDALTGGYGSSVVGAGAVADVNGDLHDDFLVLGNSSGSVEDVSFNAGYASLNLAANLSSAGTDVAAGDLNGDTVPDLVVALGSAGKVAVFLGQGTTYYPTEIDYTVGSNPVQVRLADVNQDGHLDIISLDQGSNQVSVLLGRGNGTFQGIASYPLPNNPVTVAVGDFNNDGYPDLATASDGTGYSDEYISVLLNDRTGHFGAPANWSALNFPEHLDAADVDGDGNVDLVVGGSSFAGELGVLPGFGDGGFPDAVEYEPVIQVWDGVQALTTGNFLGRGHHDVGLVYAGWTVIYPGGPCR